ncbi:hypothetical protein KFE25_005496 [Diacronema lutheri]|uniref:Nucleolar complex-associated protein 3 N-terminal domain-containing protein n=1 Tax=Diacronema lutheri TaxID=2081491 RepID=A0A8J5XC17_DIALT|nr:hypothetical protein KFE25_005496 [Diacronema lutheri]
MAEFVRKARKRSCEAQDNSVANYENQPRAERIVRPSSEHAAEGTPKRPRGSAGAPRSQPAPGGARGAPVALPAEDKAARTAAKREARRLERQATHRASAARPASEKRRAIAAAARAVLLDPEQAIGRLAAVHELATADTDGEIRALALASEAALLRDIVPDYRIRLPTARELATTPSKEVARLRKFESELLARYNSHLAVLEAVLQPAGAPRPAPARRKGRDRRGADDADADGGDDGGSDGGADGGAARERGRTSESKVRKLSRCVDAATALRCACVLLPKAIRFNHAERLVALVVAQLDAQALPPPSHHGRRAAADAPCAASAQPAAAAAAARAGDVGAIGDKATRRPAHADVAVAAARADADARAAAARAALEALFRAERCGEGSLLAVTLISELVRRRGVHVREGALRSLLAIDRAQLGALSNGGARDADGGARDARGRARGGKRKRDFGVGRDFEGLVGGGGSGAAVDGRGGRAAARVASELLRAMLVTWGRVLRAAPGARAAPAVRCALEGVAKYAHLVNIELLADTCDRLRALVAPPAASDGSAAAEAAAAGGVALRAPSVDMAAGVAAAHALLRIGGGLGGGQAGAYTQALGTAVTVGNDGLVNRRLYAAIGAAPATLRSAEAGVAERAGGAAGRAPSVDAPAALSSICVALDCAEHVCGGGGKARPPLCAAFALRLALTSLHAPAPFAIAALGAAHRVLVACPKAAAALTEPDEACGEPYAWGGPDPELSNGMNGVAWPLATLAVRSFHPTVRQQAAAVARGAGATDARAGRIARMAPADVLGTFSEAAGVLGASDEPAAKRLAQRAGSVHERADGPGSLWYPPPPAPAGLVRAQRAHRGAADGGVDSGADRGADGGAADAGTREGGRDSGRGAGRGRATGGRGGRGAGAARGRGGGRGGGRRGGGGGRGGGRHGGGDRGGRRYTYT